MSGSKWRYSPEKCDGNFCPGECDDCPKCWEDDDEEDDDDDDTTDTDTKTGV